MKDDTDQIVNFTPTLPVKPTYEPDKRRRLWIAIADCIGQIGGSLMVLSRVLRELA